jgi:hypothetical protein
MSLFNFLRKRDTGHDCRYCGDAIFQNINQVVLPATGMVLHSVCTICHDIPKTVPQVDMPRGSIKRGDNNAI